MKKLILFLFLSTSLFCFGQGKSALKDIQSIKFYGVDYSQVKVFGADESPAQFKDAFRRINELFITEAKKYNVGKSFLELWLKNNNIYVNIKNLERFKPLENKRALYYD